MAETSSEEKFSSKFEPYVYYVKFINFVLVIRSDKI